jgi:hypothetical protein
MNRLRDVAIVSPRVRNTGEVTTATFIGGSPEVEVGAVRAQTILTGGLGRVLVVCASRRRNRPTPPQVGVG